MPGAALVLSPRNAEKSAELARSLRNARVADSNQAVVDACEVVVRGERRAERGPDLLAQGIASTPAVVVFSRSEFSPGSTRSRA